MNYTVYHLHTDLSLLDSCTKYKDYVDKAVELNMKAIAFSEHGNIFNWVEKKMYCDEMGIKYLHACEVYMTKTHDEKVRDNYHTILISKNKEGFKELNLLMEKSTQDDHFYYKNRISFDEFLKISDNIIKISACMSSPLKKLDEEDEYYIKLLKHYDYYEIQYHNDRNKEQATYNKKLYDLSIQYNKKLIAGTDTHSLNTYKHECASMLKKAKKMSYENEADFDLTFKSYNELINLFNTQNSLPPDAIYQAIENTNLMAESVEELILDTSIKYPTLSENDAELLELRVKEKYQEKLKKGIIAHDPKYEIALKEETRVLNKLDMSGFMLFMSELTIWCGENNIPIGFCRGSIGGSVDAYMLDITDVDPIKWDTVFSRFANEDRLEVGDIDLDFCPSQRELVYEYIINRFGTKKTSYILAVTTAGEKGAIDEIGRGLEYSIEHVKKIKKDYASNPDKARKKYSELFYYFDGLVNTSIAQSVHPAGMVASPITVSDNYGCFWNDGKKILYINMDEVHEVGLVKYDILGLKNIEIIKDTFEMVGLPYPKSHQVDWNDQEVWKDIIKAPAGIFQFESAYAFDLLRRYKPTKINDLSLVNASLRPAGISYRDRLIRREFNKNPSVVIDELLKNNNGFLAFQEDVIAFLQKICGLSGSEADNIRRAIGRKQEDRLQEAMPRILEGYCKVSDKTRDIAAQEIEAFIKIIEDAGSYMFGYNHSTGYSMIGYMCGFLRYYYPIEFLTAYLNNADNQEDIAMGTELAKQIRININPIKFRYSKSEYALDKETNSIYKGIESIKFCNQAIADELYKLKDNQYGDFFSMLTDIANKTSVNSKQLNILVKLDFFSEFGNSKYLDEILKYFSFFKEGNAKTVSKQKLDNEIIYNIVKRNAHETEKQFNKLKVDNIFDEISLFIESENIIDYTINEKIEFQMELLGYVNLQSGLPDDRTKLVVLSVKPLKSKTGKRTWGYSLQCTSLGTGKKSSLTIRSELAKKKPIKKYSIIRTEPKHLTCRNGYWNMNFYTVLEQGV